MTTAAERRARTDYIVQRLVARIASETPAGAGADPKVWLAVEKETTVFVLMAKGFENGRQDEPALLAAGVQLREAWYRATEHLR